jgi:hypothetical protein
MGKIADAGKGMAIIAAVGLGIFGLSYGTWEMYNYFGPKYEQTRYSIFKGSQSYNEGMIRSLYTVERQYNAANDSDKAGLKAMTLHQFEVYDINRLPDDLQMFYNKLNNGE